MLTSVVIPAYNEEARVGEALERVLAAGYEKEVIVVNDGSTDATAEMVAPVAAAEPSVTLLQHEHNMGKGAAVRTGFDAARGDVVLVHDADLEYDPADHPRLIEPIADGRADVVYGSRFVGGEAHRVLYFWHYVGNRCLTLLSNALTNLNLTDMETGAKAFRRDVLRRVELRERSFGFEPEITAKVAALGCRVYEVGVSYAGRTYAEGKKIGWRDGVSAVRCILRYNVWDRADARSGAG